jgi:hypothetical protein
MANSRGDARGKSRGTATGDKPERPNARGKNRQTGASSDQSASASTTMSANVGAPLRLCESVLPPELCRCLHPCWRGQPTGQIFDHRETDAGGSWLLRTGCKSVGERWRGGAGSLPDCGCPVMPVLAPMLVWAADGARFSTIEKRTREGRGCRARAARAWASDGATARAVCLPRVIRSLRLLHASWRKVAGATDLRTSGAICHRSSHGRGRLQQARRMVVAKALL